MNPLVYLAIAVGIPAVGVLVTRVCIRTPKASRVQLEQFRRFREALAPVQTHVDSRMRAPSRARARSRSRSRTFR